MTCLTWLAVLAVGSGLPTDGDSGTVYQVGAASVDITPKTLVWMAGYAARKEPSKGISQRLHAKAMALTDPNGKTVVLVTLDLIGTRRPLVDAVRRRLQERHGLKSHDVLFISSHTHAGPIPADTKDRLIAYEIDSESAKANLDWTRALEDRLVEVVGQAIERRAPSRITHGVGTATFAVNRREPTANGQFKIGVNPEGPVDHSVPVLVARPEAGGDPKVVVFGYACHNTTLGVENLDLCGDYAGFAQDAIEKAMPGSVALFVTGCAGDQNPNPRGTMDLARQHGEALATTVGKVVTNSHKSLSGPVRSALAEPVLEFAGPTDRSAYEARLEDPNLQRRRHAERLIAKIDAGEPIASSYPYSIQAFALGDDLTLLGLAGEVVVDYAHRLRREHATNNPGSLWVAAYANDVFGYIPSRRVLQEGGYEGGDAFLYSSFPTPFADDVEDRIVNAVAELLKTLRN